nr:peptidylprolyl isomerase [Victivallales bacterium]
DMIKVKETSMKTIDAMVERELLYKIAKDAGVSVPDKDVDAQFAKIASSVKGGSKALSEDMGVTEASIKKRIAQGMTIEKYINDKFIVASAPPDKEVEEFYRSNQDRFLIPEKVQLSHIFISGTKDDEKKVTDKLDEIAKKSVSAELFKKYAKENSEDERSKDNGGEIGEFSLAEMPKSFSDAVSSLSPGQISKPFKSVRGWHIVRLDAKIPSRYVPTKEAFPAIKKFLAEKKAALKLQDEIQKTKVKSGYKILWK